MVWSLPRTMRTTTPLKSTSSRRYRKPMHDGLACTSRLHLIASNRSGPYGTRINLLRLAIPALSRCVISAEAHTNTSTSTRSFTSQYHVRPLISGWSKIQRGTRRRRFTTPHQNKNP